MAQTILKENTQCGLTHGMACIRDARGGNSHISIHKRDNLNINRPKPDMLTGLVGHILEPPEGVTDAFPNLVATQALKTWMAAR